MPIVLIGGNEVLQRSIVGALGADGVRIRLVAPPSGDGLQEWPATVEPWTVAGVTAAGHEAFLRGSDTLVVVHGSVIPAESLDPADLPRLAAAAASAGVRRIVQVARRGSPDIETARSLRQAAGRLETITLQATSVYGVGDDAVTRFFIMMRVLPAVPLTPSNHAVQPIWRDDLAGGIAAAVRLAPSTGSRVLDIGGPEILTPDDVYERVAAAIDRRPLRVPMPEFLATHGGRLAEALRIGGVLEASHVAPMTGDDVLDIPDNAMPSVLAVPCVMFEEGLRRLAQQLVEQLPDDGRGRIDVKEFGTVIRGGHYDAPGLLRAFRRSFKDMMPIQVGVEPVTPDIVLEEGLVISMALPGRGHAPVRVEQVTDQHVSLVTLAGHALAGMVRFSATAHPDGVKFQVMTFDTAATAVDWITLTLGAARLQDANWARVVQNVVTLSGGEGTGIESSLMKAEGDEAREIDSMIRLIVREHRARQQPPAGGA